MGLRSGPCKSCGFQRKDWLSLEEVKVAGRLLQKAQDPGEGPRRGFSLRARAETLRGRGFRRGQAAKANVLVLICFGLFDFEKISPSLEKGTDFLLLLGALFHTQASACLPAQRDLISILCTFEKALLYNRRYLIISIAEWVP